MDEEQDTDHVSPSSSKGHDFEHTENADEASTEIKQEAVDDEDIEDEEYSEEYLRLHPEARNEPYKAPSDANLSDYPDEDDLSFEEIVRDPTAVGEPFVPPSQRADAPLAGILNPELEDIDPRRYFPDFQPSGTLRFARVFAANSKPTIRNQIWWTSKTFRKYNVAAEAAKQARAASDDVSDAEQPTCSLRLGAQPRREECTIDEAELLRSAEYDQRIKMNSQSDEDDEAAWRFGPAQIWYDRMGVPANPTKFDYGLKLASRSRPKPKPPIDTLPTPDPITEEELLPVNLLHWEDDVIIDEEKARKKLLEDFADDKPPRCGWIPTQQTRTYQSFISAWKNKSFQQMFMKGSAQQRNVVADVDMKGPDPRHSIFPMDNYDLEKIRWEDDVIWDTDNITKIPEPKILTIDYEDDPKIFGIPEDTPLEDKQMIAEDSKPFDRKEHQFTKKSKMILGQVQQRQKQEEEEQMESQIAQIADKDPFNISNDDYYAPKSAARQNIHRLFFPTHMNPFKLRHFHRFPMSKRVLRDYFGRYATVHTLTKHNKKMQDRRQQQLAVEGGGEIFHMKAVQDISGCDSSLLLLEYSEEHPPLLSQPGMASKIRNYYKRKTNKDTEPEMEYGEMAFTHTSPFLGQIAPGQCLQSVENNMYRAPIYRHQINPNDFILIRTKQGFFIRKSPALFVVGQESPLYEVPSPNSKRATVFVRDFLMAFIYRLFWASEDMPRRLKMDDIKLAFPNYAESSVRKRLKQCSDFKRLGTGPEQNYWVLRDDFRLPSKEEVLNMVTPEMCCAQYSMLASEQRLKDAGYGEKYFFTPENEDESDDQVTMEDEIKCAPWNTTRAYVSAMKGKCMLDQSGIADPTGCGQGFSYVRVSTKPQKEKKEDTPQMPKRLVTGTNADLRKLPLKEAKEICREYGVREEEINSLSRWEIIDVIRTLSTQAAKARADFSGMARFARGNIRFNFADMQEKYKKYCQQVFDLQNRALSTVDVVSTDEGSSGEDSDSAEMASKIEKMLSTNKGKKGPVTDEQKKKLQFEDEERERLDLQRMIHGEVTKSGSTVSKGAKEAVEKSNALLGNKIVDPTDVTVPSIMTGTGPRKLKIYRTVKAPDGSESTRVEVISHPQLIDAYVRIRSSRDDDFIKVYAQMDEEYKEERRKEKRRIQDQLRRIRRNEMKAKIHGGTPGRPPKAKPAVEKPPKPIKASLLKMKCSACGGTGHMKTNKNCPLYGKDPGRSSNPLASKTVGEICAASMSDDADQLPSGELIAVEGTKLKFSKKLYRHAERMKSKALRLHIPRQLLGRDKNVSASEDEPMAGPSRISETSTEDLSQRTASPSIPVEGRRTSTVSKRRGTLEEADYLFGPQKSVHRRRADPRVSMSSALHEVLNDVKSVEGAEHLLHPVNAKKVKDYYDVVKKPMHLMQIQKNVTENKYELRQQLLADLKQILDNSRLYNGDNHIITMAARRVLEVASQRLAANEEKLIKLEKAINPLLDDDDMVGLAYILNEIVQECKNLPKSVAFHTRVDPKKFPTYYTKIQRPMDLGTIEQNIKEHRYTSVAEFRRDIEQIRANSEIYNGPAAKSVYTQKAAEIEALVNKKADEHRTPLEELEANIRRTLQAEERKGEVETDEEHVEAATSEIHEQEESSMMAYDENTRDSMSLMGGDDLDGSRALADELRLSDDDEDDEDASNYGGGVLQDDLALSDEDGLDEDEEEGWNTSSDLLTSQMHTDGQLNADLALSDSDDDESLLSAKRPRMDELDDL